MLSGSKPVPREAILLQNTELLFKAPPPPPSSRRPASECHVTTAYEHMSTGGRSVLGVP